jgi:hypothetical protein
VGFQVGVPSTGLGRSMPDEHALAPRRFLAF